MHAQKVLPDEKVTVLADSREDKSSVIRFLEELGVNVRSIQLKVGDYIVSDRIGIERKRIPDLLQSVTDQRLFRQLEELADSYEKPLLILEGSPETLFTGRNMHPNSIRGALASITVDYSVPILWTPDSRETAAQIHRIAYREQFKSGRELQIRAKQRCPTHARYQEFMVSGLPQVSSKLSKRLLKEFKTPKRVFSAKPERLMRVDGIGKEKAKRIWEALNREYCCED
jgi:ERCC4-type nuclease